jgi:Sec-independent protein translocase protein TatA
LPEVGRTLGSGLRDFRQALSGELPEHHDHSDPQWDRSGDDAEPELRHQAKFEPDPIVDASSTEPEPVVEPTAASEPEPAAETSEPEAAADPAPTASEPELAHRSALGDGSETQSRTEPGA